MQLVLTHKEIAAAVRAYVISQSNANPNEPITVAIREGRKGNGGTAVVEFEMNNFDDSVIAFSPNTYRPEDAVELARQEIASILGTTPGIEIIAPTHSYEEEANEHATRDTCYEDNAVGFDTQSEQPIEDAIQIFSEEEPEDEVKNPLTFDEDEDDTEDMFDRADQAEAKLFGETKSIFDL